MILVCCLQPKAAAPRPPIAKTSHSATKPVAGDAKAEARQRLLAAKMAMIQKQKEANTDDTDVSVAASPQPPAQVIYWAACATHGPRLLRVDKTSDVSGRWGTERKKSEIVM